MEMQTFRVVVALFCGGLLTAGLAVSFWILNKEKPSERTRVQKIGYALGLPIYLVFVADIITDRNGHPGFMHLRGVRIALGLWLILCGIFVRRHSQALTLSGKFPNNDGAAAFFRIGGIFAALFGVALILGIAQ